VRGSARTGCKGAGSIHRKIRVIYRVLVVYDSGTPY
jgi:hypothetical protein